MKSITYTQTNINSGNVVELLNFNNEAEAMQYFNEQAEWLNIGESTESVNNQVVTRPYEAEPSKRSMNKDFSYKPEICY